MLISLGAPWRAAVSVRLKTGWVHCRMRYKKGNYSIQHGASMGMVNDAVLVADAANFHVFNGSGRSVDLQRSMVQDELRDLLR